MLTLGVRWTMYAFTFEGADLDDFTAHSLRLPIRWSLKRDDAAWSWQVMATPSLNTDFENVDADAVRAGAMVLAAYPWTTSLSVTVGAVYGQQFGRTRAFPALGAVWKPSET